MSQPEDYWEKAGELGYGEVMFKNREVERHVTGRLHQAAVDIGKQLGLNESSYVLDLGCGDGTFANHWLAGHFGRIDGFDRSEAAVRRARSEAAKPTVYFEAHDITSMDFSQLPHYDGVFLIGILHHVKVHAPSVVHALRKITSRVVVHEPNGDNIARKLLELTPSYRASGDDSFRRHEIQRLFEEARFRTVVCHRLNLFPNFTPELVFKTFLPLEPFIESTPGLRALCTVNMFGFVADHPLADL